MKLRTITEAAEQLGVPRHRLQRGVESGRYPSMKWLNRRLVDLDTLAAILAEEDAEAEDRVGIRQLSELTGLPVTTLRRMCREGVIPFGRDRRGLYQFRATEVMAALQNLMERGDGARGDQRDHDP